MHYSHTQRGPLWLILVVVGAAAFISAWFLRSQGPVALAAACVGVAMFVLALCFSTLTVSDEGNSLMIRYGPLPLFQKRIAYESIREATPARSALIDGWGIHYIPGRGWTFNLWGFSCVRLDVNGRTIRIGSDDAESLARHIQTRMA